LWLIITDAPARLFLEVHMFANVDLLWPASNYLKRITKQNYGRQDALESNHDRRTTTRERTTDETTHTSSSGMGDVRSIICPLTTNRLRSMNKD
jgi:hypothetical protein